MYEQKLMHHLPGHIEMSQYVLPFEHTDIYEAEILARLLWIWKTEDNWKKIPYKTLFHQITEDIRAYLDILPTQRKKIWWIKSIYVPGGTARNLINIPLVLDSLSKQGFIRLTRDPANLTHVLIEPTETLVSAAAPQSHRN